MRLWIVNQNAYAPFHSAGTRHWALARHLIERGHEVTVVATSFFHKTRIETRLEPGEEFKHEVVDGVPFCWIRSTPYKGNSIDRLLNMVSFSWRVWRERGLKQLPRPDIILGSSPHPLAALAAQRLAARYKIPFVAEIRDLWPETFISLGKLNRWHPLAQMFYRLERHLYRSADRIVSVLSGARDYIESHGGHGDKFHCIPNGVELSMVPEPAAPKRSDRFTLMYAGSHGLINELGVLLDAAKELQTEFSPSKLRIQLVGDGLEKPRLIERAKLEEIQNIEFLASVPKNEIYRKLQTADAFVMVMKDLDIYRWGMSPNKLFDYLACSRPTILSSCSAFDPIGASGGGVVVKPGSVPDLVNGIRQIVNLTHQQREAMGRRGRNYVEQHFSFAYLAEELEKVLLRALPNQPNAATYRKAA